MPIYRTHPGVSLDDLVARLEARGEEIIDRHRLDDGEWSVLTKPQLRVVNFGTETR